MNLYTPLAFLIPLPLFFDFGSRSFVIHPVEYDKNLVLEAGVPLPIGLAALALIILFSFTRVVSLSMNKAVPLTLVCLAIFALIAATRVEPLKLFAVLLPVLLLLVFSVTVSQPRIVEKISKGYLAGVFFQVYLHVASIFFYGSDLEALITASRTIFGYEIYQAWISYSAVLSVVGGAGIIYALSLNNLSSRLRVLMLTFPVYLIVILAARKAALVDLALIFLINAFLMLRAIRFPEIYLFRKKGLKNALIFIFLSFLVYFFVVFSPRELSLFIAQEQRSGSYEAFMAALPTLSLFQVLTGYAPGWGGYSNFIVEVIVRSGLIGMVAYISGLTFATMRFHRALFIPTGGNAISLRGCIHIKSWFAFALGSFIIGNLVNMNIQLPYYTVNFLMINICFVFYYSRSLSEKSWTFPVAQR
jgi:hypothetical protein